MATITWLVGVEPVPDEANLLADVAPVAGALTGEPRRVEALFQILGTLEDPIESCAALKKDITWNVLKQHARESSIKDASIKIIARLLEPSLPKGYEWPKPAPEAMAKRAPGGNGNNAVTVKLEDQLLGEGVEPLNAKTFRWADCVFEGVPRKGEAEKINNHVDTLFDNTWLAQNSIPQLRTYLRPKSIEEATADQWTEELPPLVDVVDKKGRPVTLLQKYQVYCRNRRAKAKPLKRQTFDLTAADALDSAATKELSNKRPMSSVLNVIDLSTASAGDQERAKRRTEWLMKIQGNATSVKSEPPDTDRDTVQPSCPAGGQPPVDWHVSMAACVQAGVEAGIKQGQATKPPIPSFGPGARKRRIGASALNSEASQVAEETPAAPPKNAQPSAQTSTTKAAASKQLTSQAKERSASARQEQQATPTAAAAAVDSSDEDVDENDPAFPRLSKPPARPAGTVDPPPPKPPPKPPLKQTTLLPKLKICELPSDAPAVTADAVGEPLTVANAVSRFVFVPATQFGVEGIGGWVGKIHKITKDKVQRTEIHFKDADGRSTKEYFMFSHVFENFKPLS